MDDHVTDSATTGSDRTGTERPTGTFTVKRGLAEMLRGGVIMDVVDAEQAKVAEDAGRGGGHGPRAGPGRHPRATAGWPG